MTRFFRVASWTLFSLFVLIRDFVEALLTYSMIKFKLQLNVFSKTLISRKEENSITRDVLNLVAIPKFN